MVLSIIVFALMLTDYFLTIIGNRFKNKKYSEYFDFDYELNPLYQKDVEKNILINFRQIIYSIIISFSVYLVALWGSENIVEFMSGALILHNIIIIARHINNIIIYSNINTKESLVEGKIHLTRKYLLLTSKLNYLAYVLVFSVINIFSFSYFVFGGFVISILMFIIHNLWDFISRRSTINSNDIGK